MPKIHIFLIVLLCAAVLFVAPSSLSAQTYGAQHQDPDFLQALEVQFNKDLGRESEADPDYVFLTGFRVKYKPANVPAGRRSMRVVFAKGWGGGLVGRTEPHTSEVSIFYGNIANICPMPSAVPLERRLRLYSLILWHEAQHIPADGGDESPEGYRGPGVGADPAVPGKGPILEPCEHLQLHIDSYNEGCARLNALIAELGPIFSEDDCAELDALCTFQDKALYRLNVGDLSAPEYHVGCGQPIGPWIADPCDPCSTLVGLCLPGGGTIIIGPINPTDLSYSFNSSAILPQ